MSTAWHVAISLWVVCVVTMAFAMWLLWQWEGHLIAEGRLAKRRWLVGASMHSWRRDLVLRYYNLDEVDPDPDGERLRLRTIRSHVVAGWVGRLTAAVFFGLLALSHL